MFEYNTIRTTSSHNWLIASSWASSGFPPLLKHRLIFPGYIALGGPVIGAARCEALYKFADIHRPTRIHSGILGKLLIYIYHRLSSAHPQPINLVPHF